MCGTTVFLLCLFLGMAAAQQPSLDVVQSSHSSSCNDEYLVVGVDNITFEVDVSGNNSEFTFGISISPEFSRELANNDPSTSKFLCSPFGSTQNTFCVQDVTDGCSCQILSPNVFRVKNVYTVEAVNESRGRIRLIWRSIDNSIAVFHDIPEVLGEYVKKWVFEQFDN
ncbi:hypothetical protein PoB_006283000 [Plakobranchus ocellatus]|uniref:Uncharacterized protein n=1 Tax=Plakobranchus ocellatus TaxID=259542 RepID=A0AAV4CWR7_9GAST|nr:hypothetical protein PoB_006283000 [Plakobranchus ocellatus]